MTNPSTESNTPPSDVAQERAVETQSAAPGATQQDGAAPRPRGRKLRTPFRRRRSESAPAQGQGDAAPADPGVDALPEPMDEAAIAASNKMRFKPAMQYGEPVDSTAIVHVVFQLAY